MADAEGRLLWTNEAWADLILRLDHRPELAQGSLPWPVPTLVAEAGAQGGIAIWRESPQGVGALTSRHWVAFDEAGLLIGLAGFVDEVELTRRLRAQLALSRDRFEDVTRLVSDWIWEVDDSLRLYNVSNRSHEVLGRPAHLLLGRPLDDFGAFLDARGLPAASPLDRRRPLPFRDRVFVTTHANGAELEFRLSGLPIYDGATGAFRGFRGTARDVTELVRREAALIEAKETAERASEAKSRLLATVSHELRTPLNAIIGFTELILGEALGPIGTKAYKTYLGDVLSSGQRLLEIVNDIIDLAGAQSGAMELDDHAVDIGEAIRSMVERLASQGERGGLTLMVEIAPDLPRLQADGRRLKQVIRNLLSNAIKFTPAGGRIDVSAALDAERRLEIEVRDTGIGMLPEDIPTALEPFRQIDRRLNRAYEGIGLGLPLAKVLIERHGGTLRIESSLGQGTRAILTLPAWRLGTGSP
jgi:PAS domain S-box-containing protein